MAQHQGDRNSSKVNISFERKISHAKRVMLMEQIWPRLWLPIGIIILFILASTFGLWPTLPVSAHILLLAVFAIGLVASLFPLLKIHRADRLQAIRWLETKSGLAHRPATVLDDDLSNSAAEPTTTLWRLHKERARAHVKAMKAGLPRPKTARFDPHALRVPLMLALAATIGLQSERLKPGLLEAFSLFKAGDINSLRIDAWVTPPLYTGHPPVILVNGAKPLTQASADDEQSKPIKVPELSEIVIRVSGPNAQKTGLLLQPAVSKNTGPKPTKSPSGKSTQIAVKQQDGIYEFRTKLSHSVDARFQLNGRQVKKWHFTIAKDHPPAITFTQKPQASPRGSLRVSYRVADDYGVIEATANITKGLRQRGRFGKKALSPTLPSSPAPGNLLLPLGSPPSFPLLLPKGKSKRGSASTYKDLTSHPWAGLEVDMVLIARDEAGKSGKSLVTQFKLPERKFTKPLAQAIIAQRRTLVESPFEHKNVADVLNQLTKRNLRSGNPDLDHRAYLALRSVYWRLRGAQDRATIRSGVDQLWEIALTIEDGNLSKAERELRGAQDRLMDALAKNASPKEISKLMKELRQALNKFLTAVAKQQNNQQNADPQQQPPGNQRKLSSKELDKMLRDIENMAKTGARDAAKQMLSQLREMLENLQKGQPKGSAQAQQARKQLDQLGKMIMQQRRLLDETHRQGQKSQRAGKRRGRDGQRQRQGQRSGQSQRPGQQQGQGQFPGPGEFPGQGEGQQREGQGSGDQQRAGAQGLKRRQGNLLDGLNDLMDQMGRSGAQIPQDLMRAGSNMGQAESQLGRQQMNSAGQQQGKALENLRKGAKQMAEQMMQKGQGQGRQGNRDPLGRAQRTSGPDFGDNVKVPREIDTRRARDILEELRRRLGQSTRPPAELDYLERLIEQF